MTTTPNTTYKNATHVQELADKAHAARERINLFGEFTRTSIVGDFEYQEFLAGYLYPCVENLVRRADELGVVSKAEMIRSGVWIENMEIRTKGDFISIRSEEHEKRGSNGKSDTFMDTFERAVRHVDRYARSLQMNKQPHGYGPGLAAHSIS